MAGVKDEVLKSLAGRNILHRFLCRAASSSESTGKIEVERAEKIPRLRGYEVKNCCSSFPVKYIILSSRVSQMIENSFWRDNNCGLLYRKHGQSCCTSSSRSTLSMASQRLQKNGEREILKELLNYDSDSEEELDLGSVDDHGNQDFEKDHEKNQEKLSGSIHGCGHQNDYSDDREGILGPKNQCNPKVGLIAAEENFDDSAGEGRTSSSTESRTVTNIMAVDALLSSDPIDIEAVLSAQEAILKKRRMLVGKSGRKQKRLKMTIKEQQSSGSSTVGERWRSYLLSLEDDFFTSAEARMKEGGRVGKGKPAYRGLALQPENNYDIKNIYEMKYRTKFSLGQPTGSFDQLRTAAGQFLRLYITVTKADAREFYKRGRLLESITDLNIIRALLGYFRIRGSHSTVAAKSMHLKTLADHAQIYFSGRDEVTKGKALSVATFLLSESASEKTEARRFARRKKSTDERLLNATMFLPQDFRRCMEAARIQLDGIKGAFRRLEAAKGSKRAAEVILRNKKILQKWNINFLGLLVLNGGGQRPQVFSQLQLPSTSELAAMTNQEKKLGYIELRTVIEKTRRSFDMPNVTFPSNVSQYIFFHAITVRPMMMKSLELTETGLVEKTLLIDTRSGDPLSSHQIASTFRSFLSRIDGELLKITPMALRGSYATMMLQAYRKGRIFKEKNESDFLEFLAKSMNTSVEQLANTYAGNEMSDFEKCAREFTSVLADLDSDEPIESFNDMNSDDAAAYMWS